VAAALVLRASRFFQAEAAGWSGRSAGDMEMRLTLFSVMALILSGCNGATKVDPEQPFRIEFGRGNGWHGLDTVSMTADGKVVLYRQGIERCDDTRYQYWETTSLSLPNESVGEVLAAIEKEGLMQLDREYHGGVADGTQRVFWLQQGANQKSIYCDNNFPKAMTRFAESLDAILARNGLGDATWERVPDSRARDHEKDLWKSIRQ
jgi:hypothetical protein